MGAELYIIEDVGRRKGSFKDPYNDWSLFSFLTSNTTARLSWWRFAANSKWFDKNGNMTLCGAREFRKIFVALKDEIRKKKDFVLEVLDPKATRMKHTAVYKSERLKAGDVRKYKDRLDQFISFLDLAIKVKSRIFWST